MYDLIGDIHGHADELEHVLKLLGYHKVSGSYRHSERKIIFLGDFIDRGRQIREVLDLVRGMVETGNASAVMGNHEWNALAFHTESKTHPGEFLRPHTPRNYAQFSKTAEQISPNEMESYLEWFRSLPMWLDLPGLRVVHACWDEKSMSLISAALQKTGGVNTEFLQSAHEAKSELFMAVESVLKGKEIKLPAGRTMRDKDGTERSRVRTRWYLSPHGHTYDTYAFGSSGFDCHDSLDAAAHAQAVPYPESAKPVFIGHYWLSGQQPQILADNVACLDFSVAKGGFLCAYRWNGEQKLDNANFVSGRAGSV